MTSAGAGSGQSTPPSRLTLTDADIQVVEADIGLPSTMAGPGMQLRTHWPRDYQDFFDDRPPTPQEDLNDMRVDNDDHDGDMYSHP